MNAKIVRLEENDGMFGILLIDGNLFCWTVERPDEGNIPNVSCIPEGQYDCYRIMSPKFGDTFEVSDVPGRSNILFHAANFPRDLKGCIGLGKEIGYIGQERAVIESRSAVSSFMKLMGGTDEFSLQIIRLKM